MNEDPLKAGEMLRVEIHKAIRRIGLESDITVYQALGVLRIVERDLIDRLESREIPVD